MSPLPEPTWERAAAPPRGPRRLGTAVLLAVLLGPLGLFYVSLPAGLLMTFAVFVAGISTVGVAAVLLWPVCVFIAAILALASRDAGR